MRLGVNAGFALGNELFTNGAVSVFVSFSVAALTSENTAADIAYSVRI